MGDLISRSALLLKLRQEVPDKWDADINYFICNAPTVEAEPLRHGKWEYCGFDSICSVCGYRNKADGVTRIRSDHNYCPNCGAKMVCN